MEALYPSPERRSKIPRVHPYDSFEHCESGTRMYLYTGMYNVKTARSPAICIHKHCRVTHVI